MIKKVTGDILLTDAQAIAHGIAPHDHFNQGLALSLRERYPSMAKDFRHFCHQENPEAGNAWLWAGPGKVIINLMTQDPAPNKHAHPGKASIQNVNHTLKALKKLLNEQGVTSLALPRVATGVGGLEWQEVEPLIQKHLDEVAIPIYVYETYEKDKKAKEKA